MWYTQYVTICSDLFIFSNESICSEFQAAYFLRSVTLWKSRDRENSCPESCHWRAIMRLQAALSLDTSVSGDNTRLWSDLHVLVKRLMWAVVFEIDRLRHLNVVWIDPKGKRREEKNFLDNINMAPSPFPATGGRLRVNDLFLVRLHIVNSVQKPERLVVQWTLSWRYGLVGHCTVGYRTRVRFRKMSDETSAATCPGVGHCTLIGARRRQCNR